MAPIPDPGAKIAISLQPGLAPLALLAALGCGGGAGAHDAARFDAAPTIDADPSAPPGYQPHRVGHVDLIEGSGVFAAVHDRAELPEPELLATDGECAIYVHPEPASCDPACTDGFCVATDQCEPWPTFASAGPITVTGLVEPLVFAPDGSWYVPDPQPTSEDLFAAGAAITASAPGDVSSGFGLSATGVAPLAADLPVTLELFDGVDEEITWTAAGDGRIQLALRVGWHGAPYEAMLLCETDDDGALTVPGSLVTQLPRASSGLEQHLSWLARFDRAVVATSAGPIELFVASQQLILQISHP